MIQVPLWAERQGGKSGVRSWRNERSVLEFRGNRDRFNGRWKETFKRNLWRRINGLEGHSWGRGGGVR